MNRKFGPSPVEAPLGTESDDAMRSVVFWPKAPSPGEVTAYDYRHVATYVRLLEAELNGVSDMDMARFILRIDPSEKPRIAEIAVQSHLRRAHWLLDNRFGPLLWCLDD